MTPREVEERQRERVQAAKRLTGRRQVVVIVQPSKIQLQTSKQTNKQNTNTHTEACLSTGNWAGANKNAKSIRHVDREQNSYPSAHALLVQHQHGFHLKQYRCHFNVVSMQEAGKLV